MKKKIYSTKNVADFIVAINNGLFKTENFGNKFIVLKNEIIFWDISETKYSNHSMGIQAYCGKGYKKGVFGGGQIEMYHNDGTILMIFVKKSTMYGYPKKEIFLKLLEEFKKEISTQIKIIIRYDKDYDKIWENQP